MICHWLKKKIAYTERQRNKAIECKFDIGMQILGYMIAILILLQNNNQVLSWT